MYLWGKHIAHYQGKLIETKAMMYSADRISRTIGLRTSKQNRLLVDPNPSANSFNS